MIDLQVIQGQTVKPGLGVEVVPDWQQRGRFGGIRGRVAKVSLLPATPEDINTTIGIRHWPNPWCRRAVPRKAPSSRSRSQSKASSERNKPGDGGSVPVG